MDESKIRLSEEEWQLVQNSAWILTKHAVIGKVYDLFGRLSQQLQSSLGQSHGLPASVLRHGPKISKGEQYERMPWVVLDYPRCFGKEDVFAIRTFFWWGHYFSCTLHLKGIYAQEFGPTIRKRAAAGKLDGYYLGDDGAEFDFDVRGKGYVLLGSPAVPGIEAGGSAFIKLAFTHPLGQWDEAPEKLLEAFHTFMSIVAR
jgi:hypothetical protein